jgi:hypothetical protein
MVINRWKNAESQLQVMQGVEAHTALHTTANCLQIMKLSRFIKAQLSLTCKLLYANFAPAGRLKAVAHFRAKAPNPNEYLIASSRNWTAGFIAPHQNGRYDDSPAFLRVFAI